MCYQRGGHSAAGSTNNRDGTWFADQSESVHGPSSDYCLRSLAKHYLRRHQGFRFDQAHYSKLVSGDLINS